MRSTVTEVNTRIVQQTFNNSVANKNEIDNFSALLQRVNNAQQLLQDLVKTSLPLLLLKPEPKKSKSKKKKLKYCVTIPTNIFNSGCIMNVAGNKKLKTKKGNATITEKLQKNNRINNTKITVNKNNSSTGQRAICVAEFKKNATRLQNSVKNETSLNLPTLPFRKSQASIHEQSNRFNTLEKEKENEKFMLKHSSLFSILEKSYLRTRNFDPIEIDTLLLQKLVHLDSKLGHTLIESIINNNNNNSNGLTPDLQIFGKITDDKKTESKIKSSNKRILIQEIYDTLLSRLLTNNNRPAAVLYNVVYELCKKNKIALTNRLNRLSKKKKVIKKTYLKK